MENTVLKIDNLSKNYKNVKALSNLSLTVPRGKVFGILGPNGSGKTTTLGILLGVINANEGSFSWFDNGCEDINRKKIGALLETPNFFPYLDAVKNLRLVCKIKNLENPDERIEKVLKAVNLYERKDSLFKSFSLGMKQRLAIGSALLNDPEVLVLDEPTNGLDPQGIAEIRELIRGISKEGKTIIIASHQLDEIEKVCTDVAILKQGKLIKQSGIADIIGVSRQFVIMADDVKRVKEVLMSISGLKLNRTDGNRLWIDVHNDLLPQKLNELFFKEGIILGELREIRKSLEEQFLEITK